MLRSGLRGSHPAELQVSALSNPFEDVSIERFLPIFPRNHGKSHANGIMPPFIGGQHSTDN
jgi:hypothetical protein